nr:hypothetical protein JVH1_2290 [Rhodococcus sp. JVH1]
MGGLAERLAPALGARHEGNHAHRRTAHSAMVPLESGRSDDLGATGR